MDKPFPNPPSLGKTGTESGIEQVAIGTRPKKARAYWATGPFEGEIRQQGLPTPKPGEVLVEALYSAVSRGSEAVVCAGRVPQSQYELMRCPHQEGEFPFPVKYGYASVGRVLTGPEELEGRTVFALFPHQTHYVLPAQEVFPVPDGVPPERAVLAANMEAALNAVWDARPLPGDRILVIGAGVVGTLAAWVMSRIPGCELTLVDIDPERRRIVDALDIRFSLPEEVKQEADLLIHASGAPEALARALSWAGFEARVIELSWFGDALVPLPLGERFHSMRLDLRASQVSHVAACQRPRWDRRRRMRKALELLREPLLDLLFTGETPFEDTPRLLPDLARLPRGVFCHRIIYPAAMASSGTTPSSA